jgi:hypothetical protein
VSRSGQYLTYTTYSSTLLVVVSAMLAARNVQRASALRTLGRSSYATPAARIGDTKVEMSPMEKGNYINYQRSVLSVCLGCQESLR